MEHTVRKKKGTEVPSQGCNAVSSSSSWPPTFPVTVQPVRQFKLRDTNAVASIEAHVPALPNRNERYLGREALLLVGNRGLLPRHSLSGPAIGRVLLPLPSVPASLNLRPMLGLPFRVLALALLRALEIATARHRARRSAVGVFPGPDRP